MSFEIFLLIQKISILVIGHILKISSINNNIHKCFSIVGHLHRSQFNSIINEESKNILSTSVDYEIHIWASILGLIFIDVVVKIEGYHPETGMCFLAALLDY